MLSLLGEHAFVCLDAIKDKAERKQVVEVLHPLVPIALTHAQIGEMAANSQCILAKDGRLCVIQSQRGFDSLTAVQRATMLEHYTMVTTSVDLIEKVGGGSCRCMLVEDWHTETVSSQTSHKKVPVDFKIVHSYDDFFGSDQETNGWDGDSDNLTIEDLPFNDYWDR